MSPRRLERSLDGISVPGGPWRIPVSPAPPLAPFPAQAPALVSPEQARGRYLCRGDSCASIFIQNSRETWMKCNYLSSISQD